MLFSVYPLRGRHAGAVNDSESRRKVKSSAAAFPNAHLRGIKAP